MRITIPSRLHRALPHRRFAGLCAVATLGALVLLGLKLAFEKPALMRQRSVASLRRDLKAGTSVTARSRDALWRAIPPQMQRRLPLLEPPDYRAIRLRAAMEVEERGVLASSAVSELLWGIGHESVKDYDIAEHEFLALGRIGPLARGALPELFNWITNRGVGRGTWNRGAAWAMARIAPDDPQVAMALVRALRAYGIENEYADINPAQFKEPANGWRPSGRRNLIRAIALLRAQSPQTLEALYEQLEHGDYGAQATAADVLGKLRPPDPETVRRTKEALLRTGQEQLPGSLNAIAKAWVDTYKRRNGPVMYWAGINITEENALDYAHMTVPVTPVEEFKTIYLPSDGFPGWGLRLRLIRALGEIGPDARDVLPLVEKESENKTNILRFDAAVAAWRISGDSQEMLSVFTDGLLTPESEDGAAALALRDAALEYSEAVTILLRGLHEADGQILAERLRSLSKVGTNAVSSIGQNLRNPVSGNSPFR